MIDADRMAEIRRIARPCLCPPHQALTDLLEVVDTDAPEFTRRYFFYPGYNKRDEGMGVHGMDIKFVLTGPLGSIHFRLTTGWVPGESMSPRVASLYPSGGEIGVHSVAQPVYDDEPYGDERDCCYNPGGRCFYDAGYTAADELLDRFIVDGEDVVWETLHEWYEHHFTKAKETP